MIAAAWADGELSNTEINALKDLLFALPELTANEWAELEIYMDSPVGAEETDRLLANVLDSIGSQADKRLIMSSITALVESDGRVTDEEASLLAQIEEAVNAKGVGLASRLSKLLSGAGRKRAEAYGSGPTREERLEDYIQNTIYYQVVSDMKSHGVEIDLEEQRVKKLCLAAGLMARIAAVDTTISEQEGKRISALLVSEWELSHPEALLVSEIAVSRTVRGLDYVRLTRSFFECTDAKERRSFLHCLFQIANTSEGTAHHEIEEIRRIAGSLLLSHKDFIQAKFKIPREERSGL